MAENQTESSPLENEELPTPQFSEKGDSSTSGGADEIVSKLLPQLEQIIERKVQSTKDKRISEIEKVLGGRSKILAELEEAGVPITKEVRAEMRIRELEERLNQPQSQPAPASVDGSTQQKAAVTEAIAKLSEYGLSSNDPAFIELLRGKYANRDAFDKAVLSHVVTKIAPPKPANPADVVQSPARAGATEKSKEALQSDYLKEMAGARGKGYQVGDAIKEKYRKQGLNVDEIVIRV
jgi:hypothetical protein